MEKEIRSDVSGYFQRLLVSLMNVRPLKSMQIQNYKFCFIFLRQADPQHRRIKPEQLNKLE